MLQSEPKCMLRHPSAPTPTVLKITHFLLRCIFNNKSSLTAGRNNQPAVEPNVAHIFATICYDVYHPTRRILGEGC